MTIVAAAGGSYEIDLPLGVTVAETVRTLRAVPDDAVLVDHYGDADLIAVFRVDPAQPDARP